MPEKLKTSVRCAARSWLVGAAGRAAMGTRLAAGRVAVCNVPVLVAGTAFSECIRSSMSAFAECESAKLERKVRKRVSHCSERRSKARKAPGSGVEKRECAARVSRSAERVRRPDEFVRKGGRGARAVGRRNRITAVKAVIRLISDRAVLDAPGCELVRRDNEAEGVRAGAHRGRVLVRGAAAAREGRRGKRDSECGSDRTKRKHRKL